ncbi:hypothetical protein [Nocardia fluminea]|uniref:hypothetical protein n=1 Tax=Nocardia fluminea TaxID=134984 RepID=UPI003669250D
MTTETATATLVDPEIAEAARLAGDVDSVLEDVQSYIEQHVNPALAAVAAHPEDRYSVYIQEHLTKAMDALDAARQACAPRE